MQSLPAPVSACLPLLLMFRTGGGRDGEDGEGGGGWGEGGVDGWMEVSEWSSWVEYKECIKRMRGSRDRWKEAVLEGIGRLRIKISGGI